ncbi:MAG: LysR family transcriptional regulator [Bdellovibrionales bacterium]
MIERDLNEITAFLAVAHEGGFTAASKRTGHPKSYLSRKVADLENRLELRLFDRTTRSVRLTEDGQRYFETCERALSDIKAAESDFEESIHNPSGHLRVTCPTEFGPLLTEKLCRKFLIKYPNITLEIFPANTIVDLVRDRFDVAIRPSQLAHQDMIAISLGHLTWDFYASPAWKDRNIQLQKLEDLRERQLIAFNPSGKLKKTWRVRGVSFKPRFIAGNLNTLIDATKQGAGVAYIPDLLIKEDLKKKKLVPALKKCDRKEEEIFALYSSRQHMPSRLRAFLDHLKQNQLFD